MNHITKNGCKGCQWEDVCEFDCPCDYHSGREELDKEDEYKFELTYRAKIYSNMIIEFTDWDCR